MYLTSLLTPAFGGRTSRRAAHLPLWSCSEPIDAVAAPTAADLYEIAYGDYLAEEWERRYPVEALLAEADYAEHGAPGFGGDYPWEPPPGTPEQAARLRHEAGRLRVQRSRRGGCQRLPGARRTPRARPAARRPRARRTTSASRDGPSDDDSGESEPPRCSS